MGMDNSIPKSVDMTGIVSVERIGLLFCRYIGVRGNKIDVEVIGKNSSGWANLDQEAVDNIVGKILTIFPVNFAVTTIGDSNGNQ